MVLTLIGKGTDSKYGRDWSDERVPWQAPTADGGGAESRRLPGS